MHTPNATVDLVQNSIKTFQDNINHCFSGYSNAFDI